MTQAAPGYRLYRAYDEAGDLLYIGQTGRTAARRWHEHMAEQPWAGEVAQWVRDPRVWSSSDEVTAAETAAIRAEWPRYNVAHNDRNPLARRVSMSQSLRRSRRWPRRVRHLAWRAGGWLALSLAVTLWCWLAAGVGLGDAALVGAGGATAVLVAVARRRGRRRSRRR